MNIDELIEKYYNGETTPDEEKILREYFNKRNERTPEKDLFEYFEKISSEEKQKEIGDEIILSKIFQPQKFKISKILKYSSIAAILIFAINIFIFNNNSSKDETVSSNKSGIIITDENIKKNRDIAIAEIKNAFAQINKSYKVTNQNVKSLQMLTKINNVIELFDDNKEN